MGLEKHIDNEALENKKHYLSDVPETCYLCGKDFESEKFIVDGAIKSGGGAWCFMCEQCFEEKGKGIGWGIGQLYKKESDKQWLQVAGFKNSSLKKMARSTVKNTVKSTEDIRQELIESINLMDKQNLIDITKHIESRKKRGIPHSFTTLAGEQSVLCDEEIQLGGESKTIAKNYFSVASHRVVKKIASVDASYSPNTFHAWKLKDGTILLKIELLRILEEMPKSLDEAFSKI